MVARIRIPQHKTFQDRKIARSAVGPLRLAKVAKATQKRYNCAVRLFLRFVYFNLGMDATTLDTLDRHLCKYIEFLWCEGGTRNQGNDAICGVQFNLGVKKCFLRSWDLMRTWSRIELPTRATPMPAWAVLGMAGYCWLNGLRGTALGLLLGFGGFLRTEELSVLTFGKVYVTSTQEIVLNLGFTKSGVRKGAAEMVTISDKPLAKLTSSLLTSSSPTDLVLGMSVFQFRTLFKRVTSALGLDPLRFRPYSLRRGGASHHFLLHHDISTTLFKGRWDSVKAGRVYIVEGVAQLADLQVSTATRNHCLHLAETMFRRD